MLRVVLPAGVILTSVPLAAFTVHASEEGEKSALPVTPAKSKTIKPSELPIYGEPLPVELEYIPEPITPYREAVSNCRQAVWSATEGMQGSIEHVKSGIAITKDFANDMRIKIQEDTGVLQRAGIITIAGLGGVVAGYKGGILRKTFLASAAMTTAAAICYPNQAVDISNATWGRVKEESTKVYQDVVGKTEKKPEPKSTQKVEMNEFTPKKDDSKDVKLLLEKKGSKSATKAQEDHGQSKKEDKDLYTTRS